MAAVKLAVEMEQEYLGFDYVDAQIEDAHVGDVVSVNYDFGAGPRKIVGTYEGVEHRDSGEDFVWVRETDKGQTRYAIPEGMIEALRIEARKESLPTVERVVVACDDRKCGATVTNVKPDELGTCPRCGGSVHVVTNEQTAASITHATRKRARAHRTLDGLPAAAYGRACARLDYEGTVVD